MFLGVLNSPCFPKADTNTTTFKSNLYFVELQSVQAGRELRCSGLSAGPALMVLTCPFAEEPRGRSICVHFWTTHVPSLPPLEGKQKNGE